MADRETPATATAVPSRQSKNPRGYRSGPAAAAAALTGSGVSVPSSTLAGVPVGMAAHTIAQSVLSRRVPTIFDNIIRYLAAHPEENSGLSEVVRSALTENERHVESASDPAAGSSFWSQGSYPVGSALMSVGSGVNPEIDMDRWTYQCDFRLLASRRSDVASLACFSQRVDHATFYLIVAVDDADYHLQRRVAASGHNRLRSWYSELAHSCFSRWAITRDLLEVDRPLPETSEPLYRSAFWSLCELTPADSQLKALFEEDRRRASRELIRHVDAYVGQLSLAVDLVEELTGRKKGTAKDETSEANDRRLAEIQEALLDKAGARLTLTEAAERIGISRQGLYQRIKRGSAIGLMMDSTFVIPEVQLVNTNGKWRLVDGLREVLALFGKPGGSSSWSAFQYLIEPDPALGGRIPLELLKGRDASMVVPAARGYLGRGEGKD